MMDLEFNLLQIRSRHRRRNRPLRPHRGTPQAGAHQQTSASAAPDWSSAATAWESGGDWSGTPSWWHGGWNWTSYKGGYGYEGYGKGKSNFMPKIDDAPAWGGKDPQSAFRPWWRDQEMWFHEITAAGFPRRLIGKRLAQSLTGSAKLLVNHLTAEQLANEQSYESGPTGYQ